MRSARSVIELAAGTATAQLLVLLSLPIVSALYSPAEFGVYVLFAAISQILSIGANGRYEAAIILPRLDSTAVALTQAAVALSLLFAVLVYLGGVLVRSPIIGWDAATVLDYLGWLSLTIASASLHRVFIAFLTRFDRFRWIAALRVFLALATVALQIAFAVLADAGARGLILGLAIASLLAAALSFTACAATTFRRNRGHVPVLRRRRAVAAAIRYRKFPAYTLPASLLGSVNQQSLPLIAGLFFSPAVVGLLGIALRIVNAPQQLIAQSLGQVLAPRLANRFARGESNVRLTVKVAQLSLLATIPVILLAAFYGRDVFAVVFGDSWEGAYDYLQTLLPAAVAAFCTVAVSRMYIYGRNRIGLIWQVAFAISSIASMLIGGLVGDVTVGLWLYSAASVILYAVHLSLTITFAGGRPSALFSWQQ